MTFYKKDVRKRKINDREIFSCKQPITILSGSRKDQKIEVGNLTSVNFCDLIDKKFFGQIAEVNGSKYLISVLV